MRYAIVVGVILLACTGLLIPSVARVREAAGHSTCCDHFKQIAVAVHNYASANQDKLHDGAYNPNPRLPNPLPLERRLSCHVLLLPYLEQDRTYRLFALDAAADDERNRLATSVRFRGLCCPSSGELKVRNGGVGNPVTGEFVYPGGDAAWKSPGPVTHYIGVAGVGANAAALDPDDPRAGLFGNHPRWTITNVPDGTAHTLMFFESALDPGHWAYAGRSTVRGIDTDESPFVGEGRPIGGFHSTRDGWFASRRHQAIVAMGDGSIPTITDRISPEVLAAFATANGHEKIPEGW